MTRKIILLVEDEAVTALDIKNDLIDLGYEVPRVVASGPEAIRAAQEVSPDLILMDITLNGPMTGIEAASEIQKSRAIPVIYLTAHTDAEMMNEAKLTGPYGYLPKPCNFQTLMSTLEMALHRSAVEAERDMALANFKRISEEQTVILREVHHRIKNNMITISGLLSLQAEELEDGAARSALEDSLVRIAGMMKIYDKLYRGNDFRMVSTASYFGDLIPGIVAVFPRMAQIEIGQDIDDRMIGSDKLFQVGIIINELITNSIKYAFSDGRAAKISVSFKLIGEDTAELVVSDNGTGLPERALAGESRGFGMSLVGMMVTQIGGQLQVSNHDGARYVIGFKI